MSNRTGTQVYPGADTSHWYQDKYPGDAMESNVVVWHSTEGTSLPDYGGGTSAPNFTAVPDFQAQRIKWYQHFGVDTSARALVNRSGGVETNTLNVVQVEVTGTCDPTTHAKWVKAGRKHLYTPDLPDWAIRDFAAFTRWLSDSNNIPMTTGVEFKAYPASYGNSDVRMSPGAWNTYKGHCGHQHVPENDHGDPGAFPMQRILDAAKGGTSTPPSGNPAQPAGTKPSVSLAHVIAAAKADPGAPQGSAKHRAEVKLVEAALSAAGFLDARWVDGSFGTKTVTAYAALQRRLGYSGAGADGIPGKHSLTWLALKSQKFKVVP